MAKKELFGLCPYVTSLKVLTGKWSLYLLYLLTEHPGVRFNELQRLMPEEMTHTTLSRQLKFLEEEGLIVRKEYAQIPPKVEYSLSEIGKSSSRFWTLWGFGGRSISIIGIPNNRTHRLHSEKQPKVCGIFP